nr:hypothetical protein [Tanacetum cinerariifolium]
THLREKVLAAQYATAAHADQVDARTARVDERGHDIDIARSAFHALLILHASEQTNLIAQFGGVLEVEVHRRLFHERVQLVGQGVAAALEEHHGVTHILGIHLGLDEADTRCLATLDLVLQTGPCAVLIEAVLALTHMKSLLQNAQAFTNGTGAGIGTEIPALGLFRAAMNAQPRKLTIGQMHIRVGFVVAQENVV